MVETKPNGNGDRKEDSLRLEGLSRVERVDNLISEVDIETFYGWFQNEESSRHFDPKFTTLEECKEYYRQPDSVFLVARNFDGEPIGVLTVKKDPFIKEERKVAYIEKMIVNPKLKNKGIGTVLLSTTLDHLFGKDNQDGWEECRAWIMTDKQSGSWWDNYYFFINNAGFQIVNDYPLWSQYSREVDGKEVDREALWLYTNSNLWNAAKARNSKLTPVPLELF